MCGIALTINGTLDETLKMGKAISRRGIKSSYKEIDNLKVSFTWLPIVNDKADQPITIGKCTVWLNGFISNYKELAKKYNIPLWMDSDTLLLAEFINRFSFEKLDELNGFFSVVVYDGKFHCFTDRYGIKQLYKYQKGETTYICSEIKGIKVVVDLEFSPEGVEDWKHSLGIMTDSIYKIEKIPRLPFPEIKSQYISYEDAKDELKRLLNQSFERNKISNSGVFLSGGVDSGIIASWLKPDYSFSMDYLNELSEIENIKLNSQGKHYTMICNNDLWEKYRKVSVIDDPKCGSCYTNFALTELASKFCKVIYSGAGGDELFYGYTHRYNKPINEVIRRNGELKDYQISHEEYDWKFLRGIFIVEDRIGGFHTMETRYPYLDNDLVNFVLSLPKEYRFNKRILKDISGLPEKVINGKKRGFSNPISNKQWIDEVIHVHNCV